MREPGVVAFVFCADPLAPRRVEPEFAREVAAAERAGARASLIDHDALVAGELDLALAAIGPRPGGGPAIYRGWMLTPERYAALHAGLAARGLAPINDPAAYRLCHHLPGFHHLLEGLTPRSVWIPREDGFALPAIMRALAPFGARPLVLKDYVKSAKHAWLDACFIPSAADAAEVARVVGNFLAWQGEELNGGLVFREHVDLEPIGVHAQSGLPLGQEYRALCLDGRVLAVFPYWDADAYQGRSAPPRDWLEAVAARVPSRFFSLDVARLRGPEEAWTVIELGDGQVTGIPAHVDPGPIVSALARLA